MSNFFHYILAPFVVPLRIALHSLRTNRMRTVLTMVGIIIGIASVIAIMSAGEGLKAYVVGQVSSFGTDYIQVETKIPSTDKNSSANAGGQASGIVITTLKIDDALALRRVPNVRTNYAGTLSQRIVSYGDVNKQINLFGTSSTFIDIDPVTVALGRFYSDAEDNDLASVVVLGSEVRRDLFGDADPIDQWIKVGRQKFRVIGVLNSKGSGGFFNMDAFIFMPVRTLQKKVMGVDYVSFIFNQVIDTKQADQTADEMTQVLRQRHEITNPIKDDFAVTTMAEALDTLNVVFGAVSLLLIAVSGVSLLVGGVGIMNIMYVSVTERTYEIGLRKAVGATGRSILLQFLAEAIVVTGLGGFIGIVCGLGLAAGISALAQLAGFALPFIILPSALIIACGVALIIGLVFGVFPARLAARLDPVRALRANQ